MRTFRTTFKKPLLYLLFTTSLMIGGYLSLAQFTSAPYVVRTVHIIPTSVTAEGWNNVESITFQNLSEFALIQEFNTINSATMRTDWRSREQLRRETSVGSSESAEASTSSADSSVASPADVFFDSEESTDNETDEVGSETITDENVEVVDSATGTPADEVQSQTDVVGETTDENSGDAPEATPVPQDEATTTVLRRVTSLFALAASVVNEVFATSGEEQTAVVPADDANEIESEAEVVNPEFAVVVDEDGAELPLVTENIPATTAVTTTPATTAATGSVTAVASETSPADTTTTSPETIDVLEGAVDAPSATTTPESPLPAESDTSVLESANDLEEPAAPIEPCVENCLPYTITLRNFGFPLEPGTEISGAHVRMSFAAKRKAHRERVPTFDMRFSLDGGETWATGGSVVLTDETANSVNGGYFLFALPQLESEADLEQLAIELRYDDDPTIMESLFVESVWLELFTIERGDPVDPAHQPFAFDDNYQTEPLSGDTLVLPDGEVIEFTFTDETDGETLIIKSSQRDYVGLSRKTAFFNVTNTSNRADTFQLQTYFPEELGEVRALYQWNQNKPRQVVIPEFRPYVYHCDAGWESTTVADDVSLVELSRTLVGEGATTSSENNSSVSGEVVSPVLVDDEAITEPAVPPVDATVSTETREVMSDEVMNSDTDAVPLSPSDDEVDDFPLPDFNQAATTSVWLQPTSQRLLQQSVTVPRTEETTADVSETTFFTDDDVLSDAAAATPAASEVDEMDDEVDDETDTRLVYVCRNTNVVRACDRVDGDSTNCHQDSVRVQEHTLTHHQPGWEQREFNPGARPNPNLFTRAATFLGFGPQTKPVPDRFEVRTHTDRDFTIQPGETLYFKIEIEFPPFSAGEWWVEAIGAREYGLLDPFWSSQWEYRKKIEISGTDFTTDQRETQVLVELDDSLTDFWANVKSDGGDIRFVQQERTPASTWYGINPATISGWYDVDWSSRLPITINASEVDATLTNFPVYVDLSTLGSDFFNTVRSDGGDIRVTGSDEESEMPVEVVWIDTGAEAGEIHFRADTLSATEDTTFYIYFGNASATLPAVTSTYGRNNVWSNGYEAVYHLQETGNGTTGEFLDSTGNNRNATGGGGVPSQTPSATTTFLGTGQFFNITNNQFITNNLTASQLNLGGAGQKSISMWAFTNSMAGGDGPALFQLGSTGTNLQDFSLRTNSATVWRTQLWGSDIDWTYPQAIGQWTHFVQDYDGSTVRNFANGVVESSAARALNTTNAENFRIGRWRNGYWDGVIDEVRVSSVARSADWYAAEHSNQINPVTFYATSTTEGQPTVTGEIGIWPERIPLTIDADNIDADLTDFVMYVDLATLGSDFFTKVQSDGADIRITAGDGDTQLPRDIVSIDTSSGTGELYFKTDFISSSVDTTFYIYYGNATADPYDATDPFGSEAVWTDYAAVWHFAEGSGTTAFDSTGNNNNGTLQGSPTWTTGPLGTALQFNGNGNAGNRVTIPAFLSGTNDITVSVWFNQTAVQTGAGNWTYVLHSAAGQNIAGGDFWLGRLGNESSFTGDIGAAFAGTWNPAQTDIELELDTFYHVTAVHADGQVRIYVDGQLTRTRSQSMFSWSNAPWAIGAASNGYRSHPGIIDSPRVATVSRSSEWIAAEFANQNNPSAFYATSSPQTPEPPTFVELDYWIQHFDYAAQEADIWVQTDLLRAGATNTIEMYYGKADALTTSDRYAPFTYSTTTPIYHVVNPDSTGIIRVVSLIDNNVVRLDNGSDIALNRGEVASFTTYTASSTLYVLGPVASKIVENAAEGLVPISFASTAFAIPNTRGNPKTFGLYAPFAAADFDIYFGTGASPLLSGTIAQGHTTSTALTNNGIQTIEATAPVLVFSRGGTAGDSLLPYPPTTRDLFGIRSQSNFISPVLNGTSFSINCSNGASSTVSGLNRGQRTTNTTCDNGTNGTGNAVRIFDQNQPIAAIQQADGGGTESVSYWPEKEWSNEYHIPADTGYMAFVCSPRFGTSTIQVLDTFGSIVEEDTCAPGADTPGQLVLNGGSPTVSSYFAGYRVRSTNDVPFFMYIDVTEIDRNETSLLSLVQGRKYISSSVQLSFGAQTINQDAQYDQLAYRWYENVNSLTPSNPWPLGTFFTVQENEPIENEGAVLPGDVLRLRMSLEANENDGLENSAQFRLQYAQASQCSSVPSSQWQTIGAQTDTNRAFRAFSNSSVSNGATLTTLRLSQSTVAGSYSELPLTVPLPNRVDVSEVVEYDWVLEVFDPLPNSEYCFRMIRGTGAPLASYTRYPQLSTGGPPFAPEQFLPFDNEHQSSLTPRFEFRAIDDGNNDLHYQIQLANDFDFSSIVFDRNSISNSNQFEGVDNPADKAPFGSGAAVAFVSSPTLTNGQTYWWRTRARDPDGSNEWGDWSQPFSFTVNTSIGLSEWYQNTSEQFLTNQITNLTVTAGTVTNNDNQDIGEYNNATIANGVVTTINLANTYTNPVVVASVRYNRTTDDQRVARVVSKTSTSFDILIDNYDSSITGNTTFDYLVVEAGNHTIDDGDDGTRLLAGTVPNVSAVSALSIPGNPNGRLVQFSPAFTTDPVVLATISSNNTGAWAFASMYSGDNRNNPPTNEEVRFFLNRNYDPVISMVEDIDYVAIEPTRGTLVDGDFEVIRTGLQVNDASFTVNFSTPFASGPAVTLVQMMTNRRAQGGYAMTDTATPATTTNHTVAIDQDGDGADRVHPTTEMTGHIVFESSAGSILTAIPNGVLRGTEVIFSLGQAGNAWGEFDWDDVIVDGEIRYQLEYRVGLNWQLIPDSALPGNADGFTNGPIELIALDPLIYSNIRPVASFVGEDLTLNNWRITWGERVGTPVINSPFNHEKVATTTPLFRFVSEDPAGGDLEYEFSFADNRNFTSSTTYNSSTSAGFVNLVNAGDVHPFTESEEIGFSLPSALTEGNTYFWRVRAKDPGGSDTFSPWSQPSALTIDLAVDRSTWFQGVSDQFRDGELFGTLVTNTDTVTVSNVIGEYGKLVINNNEWTQVDFANEYANPVVITSERYFRATETQRTSRVRNKTSTSFEVFATNWDNSVTGTTTIDWVVMEAGDWLLDDGADGVRVIAATELVSHVQSGTSLSGLAPNQFDFDPPFSTAPAVLATVSSVNSSNMIYAAVNDGTSNATNQPSASSLGLYLQKGQVVGTHPPEDVDYIAFEPSRGENFGSEFEFIITARSISHTPFAVNFSSPFSTVPQVALVQQSSHFGTQLSYMMSDLGNPTTINNHTVSVDEDGPTAARTHSTEQGALAVFQNASGTLLRISDTGNSLSGTFSSSPINFSDGSGPKFEEFSWIDTTPGTSTAVYRVEYRNSFGVWQLIPDSVLPGNVAGTSTSPIGLTNIDAGVYDVIRLTVDMECDGNDCPELDDWTVTWTDGFDVSGVLREVDRTTAVATGTVRVAVNGILASAAGAVAGNGTWSVSGVTAFAGDTVTVYVDTATSSARAANIMVYDGLGDITGVQLYEQHLTLSSNENAVVSNANMSQYDNSVAGTDAVFFDVDGTNNLTVCAVAGCDGFTLFVGPGNRYRPASSGSVSTRVPGDFVNRGTVTLDANTLRVGGSWDDAGTVNMNQSTVIFTATSTDEIITNAFGILAFHNLTFGEGSGTARWEPQNAFSVTGNLSVNHGTLLRERASAITLSGNLSTGANGFWSGAGTTTVVGANTVTWNDVNSVKQNIGTLNMAGSGKIINVTSDVRATNVIINANNTLRGGSGNTIEVAGNWTNAGTFTAQTSEVRFIDDPDGFRGLATAQAWFDGAWSNRVEITIPAASINDTLSDFPVYLNLSAMPAEFWDGVAGDGADIRITGGDGTTQVPVEVVWIATSTETGEVHFRASTLSASTDTIFYVYFNNPAATLPAVDSAFGRNNVWSNGYEAVFHLNQTATGAVGEFVDSTGNGHDARGGNGNVSQLPSAVAGQLGTAQSFDGGNYFIQAPVAASGLNMGGATAKTVTAWARINTGGNTGGIVGLGTAGPAAGSDYTLRRNGGTNGWRAQHWGGADHDFNFGTAGVWAHYALDYDGAVSRVFANGNVVSNNTTSLNTGDGFQATIGVWRNANWFDGAVDEVRFASTNRPQAWYQAEFLNQNNPNAFMTVESEIEVVQILSAEFPSHTVVTGGASFYDLAIDDATTTVSFVDAIITTSRDFIIDAGIVTLPVDRLTVGGSFRNNGGIFAHNNSEVRMTGTATNNQIIQGFSGFFNEFYDLRFTGTGQWALQDAEHVVRNNLTITNGTPIFPSGELRIVGDMSVTGSGAFNANNGTVVFASGAINTVSTNGSSFYDVRVTTDSGAVSGWLGAGAASDWYDANWLRRIPITIDASAIDATLTDFPVKVDLDVLGSDFFSQVRSNGGDIRVTAGDGTTELPVEVVFIDTGNETGEIHFRADELSASSDTTFYIYFSNPTANLYAATAPFGRNAVWSNGFEAVYHLNSTLDSSGNGRDLVALSSPTPLGSAYEFDGNLDRLRLPSNFDLFTGTSDFTVTLHFNTNTVAPGTAFGTSPVIYSFRTENNAMLTFGDSLPGSTLGFRYEGWTTPVSTASISTGVDYGVTVTYDASGGGFVLYRDGVSVSTASGAVTISAGNAQSVLGGVDETTTGRSFNGIIYDFRVASTTRSAAWTRAEYLNWQDTSFLATSTIENVTFTASGWGERQPLTIPASEIADDLVDFPVFVDLSDLGGSFFNSVKGDGSDIRVTTADGVTEVPYELVSISTSTQSGELYFLAPNLSSTTDTTFYIYYGNELAAAYAADDPLGSEAVWVDYAAVWHFAEGSGSTAFDSTGNNNDGTLVGSPSWTTGKLGGALQFNGNGDSGNRVTIPAFLSGTTDLTVSTWFTQDGAQSGAGGWTYIIHSSSDTSVGSADFWLGRLGSPDPEQGTIGAIFGGWASSLGHTGVTLQNDNRFYHVMAVHSDDEVRIYVNGQLERTRSQSMYSFTNRAWGIGAGTGGYRSHPGIIDSPRFATVSRSSEWIAAEFSNQNDPSSFYTLTVAEQFGTRDFVDTNTAVARNFFIEAGTARLPSGTLSVGGSFTNQATMETGSGTVRMSGASSGTHTVNPGGQEFHNFQIDTANGTLNLNTDFTVANAFTVTSANNVILATSTTLTVANTFTNSSSGAGTTWNGTLRFTSGNDQTINAKANAGDAYGTFDVQGGATIGMWNSTIANVLYSTSSAVYSQNNAGVPGDLFIYGDYLRDSGTEHWRHDVDFDGVSLASTPRAVNVRVASSSSVTIDSANLVITGTSTASTTIGAITGTYTFILTGADVSAQYFTVAGTDSDGMQWLASTTITQFEDGLFDVATSSFTGISIDDTTIDTNPTSQFERIGFTSSDTSDSFNVTRVGSTPSSFVWFREGFGNLYGEAFDQNDADPGNIRFDDSSITIAISGTVYSDTGSTPLGAPTCDGVTNVVRVVVNGGGFTDTVPCATDGTYSFPAVSFIGDPDIIVYLDTDGGAQGSVVTRTPLVDITDMDVYQNWVIVRHESAQPIRITRMNQFDNTDDSDIGFAVSGGLLEVLPGYGLYVAAGKTFTPGGVVTLTGGGQSNVHDGSLALAASATFNTFATSTLTIGGSLTVGTGATLTAASSTARFTASTTGKTITGSSTINFYELEFDGVGGEWTLNSAIQIVEDVVLENGTLTGTGNITIPNGTFTGNGTLAMTGGTVTLNTTGSLTGTSPWTFYNLQLGTGSPVATTTLARTATTTVANVLTVTNPHRLRLGTSALNLAGSGSVIQGGGQILSETSTIRYSGTSATVAPITYYDLVLDAAVGPATYTGPVTGLQITNDLTIGGTNASTLNLNTNDPVTQVEGDVTIQANGTLEASNVSTFTVAGDWTDDGTFVANDSTVRFTAPVSTTINAGASAFANVVIDAVGDVTVARHATATASWLLENHDVFTVASGQVLAVGNNFQNTLGGAGTVWTGSTLRLFGGNYQANASTTSDTYDTLQVVDGAQVRVWNTTASSYDVAAGASLYSQDHEEAVGELYIFGDYLNTSRADFWSYETNWDGTNISATPRQAQVFVQGGGSVTWQGGSLTALGAAGATTTVAAFGSGVYDMLFTTGATVNVNRLRVRDITAPGVQFTGTPSVTNFSRTDLLLAIQDGYTMTVEASAIDANPSRNFVDNIFNEIGGLTDPRNVRATGTAVSAWRFTGHTGNIAGESFDDDDGGDPGYIVWDDSTPIITISGRVYQSDTTTVSGVCDGTTNNIRLAVAGIVPVGGQTSCDAGTGVYTFTGISFSANDTLTVFIAGETPRAVTVSKDPISSISNMDLYESHVIVRHESTSPLSIADMSVYDSGDSTDILFTASAGPAALTIAANTKLLVWGDRTFRPEGDVTITGGGSSDVAGGSLELRAGAELELVGTDVVSVGGNFTSGTGATVTAGANTELRFTSTDTGRTIAVNESTIGNVRFTGSGAWTLTDSTLTTQGDVLVEAGVLTLPSATSTIGGSLVATTSGLTITTGPLVFDSAAANNDIAFGGATTTSLTFTGTGSWVLQDAAVAVAGDVTITGGTLTLPDGELRVTGDFNNLAGAVVPATSELVMINPTAAFIRASSSDLHALTVEGGGVVTLVDTDITFQSDVTVVSSSTLVAATGTTAIGGSFQASDGVFDNASGTMLFNAPAGGRVIEPGDNDFYNVVIGAPAGGYVMQSATTTNNFTLSAANSFTLDTGETLYVGGVFLNLVGGSATNWTDTTLILGPNNAYTINTKATPAESYATLEIQANSAIRMWNSTAAVVVDESSSLYSMNHGDVSGALNLYGDFQIGTSTEHWSYARDFDGIALGVNARPVAVRLAPNATTTVSGTGALQIIGDPAGTTTIERLSPGTYTMVVTGGTFEAEHYSFRHLSPAGLQFSGTPVITNLAHGYFELASAGGRLITITAGALSANPSRVFDEVGFADPGALGGFNVELIGTTGSAWRFRDGYGNLYGEDFDIDGSTDCGSIRFNDSLCLLSQQSQFRWRNDNGGLGAPTSEWYDLDWENRAQVRIQHLSPSASNVPVKVVLPHVTGMDANFADLRFTAANGQTIIPHWVERFTVNDEAVVWVLVPQLTLNEVESVYVYFNNTSAANTSNAANVFNVVEDFESGSLAAYSGQTTLFTIGTSTVYGGANALVAANPNGRTNTGGITRADVTVSQGEIIRFMQYIDATSGSSDEICTKFAVSSSSPNQNYAVCLELFGTDRLSIVRDVTDSSGSGVVLASSTLTFTTGWYEVFVDWRTNGLITASLYAPDGSLATSTSVTDTTYTSGGIGFSFWFNHGAWDSFVTYPRYSGLPTTFVGAPQTPGGASWAAAQNSPVGGFETGDVARLRVAVENQGLDLTNQQYRLEYAEIGAAATCASVPLTNFIAVPNQASCGSSPVCMATSTHITSGATTSDLLFGSLGAFTPGRAISDPDTLTASLNLAQNSVTELEFVITPTNNAEDALCFIVTNNGTRLDFYEVVPELQFQFDPIVSTVFFNDGVNIDLLPGTTTTIVATTTVTDFNGVADIVGATTTFYKTSATALCAPDDNTCYIASTPGSCQFLDCTAVTCTLVCTAEFTYHTEPTADPLDPDQWFAFVEVVDSNGGVGFNTSGGVDVNELRALSVSNAIAYGPVAVEESTGTFNPTIDIFNLGNVGINLEVSGTDMTDGNTSVIDVSLQRFSTSTFNYDTCGPTECISLATTPTEITVDLPKPTVSAPFLSDRLYWGISILFGTNNAPHTGFNTFVAIPD